MMKRAIVKVVLLMLLVSFVVSLTGCEQMGETAAEGHRRHVRLMRLHKQQLAEDMDALFMLEKPSARCERTIP